MNEDIGLTKAISIGRSYIRNNCPRYKGGDWKCIGPACCAHDFCDKQGKFDPLAKEKIIDFAQHDGQYFKIL